MGTAINIKRPWIALMMLLCIASSCKTQGWQFSANKYDLRTAQITAEGRVNGRAIHTKLSLDCKPGPDGTVGICYFIYDADMIKEFNFDVFEGPYAPASSKKLTDVDVVSSRGTTRITASVAGFYAEYNVFCFCMSAMNRGKSDARKIAEALMKGADNIIITVHDMKNPAVQCKTNFPAMNASTVIEKTIRGCCTN